MHQLEIGYHSASAKFHEGRKAQLAPADQISMNVRDVSKADGLRAVMISMQSATKDAVRDGAMEVVSADLEAWLQCLKTPLQDTLHHMLSIISDP